MKSVVLLLLLAAIQLSAAYNYNSYNSNRSNRNYTPPKPTSVFTYEKNFQTALQRSKAERKPILVISHLTNCRACKDLFNDLPKNRDIPTLAEKYIVVHSLDGSDEEIDNLGPRTDKYFPRCFIYGSDGKMMPIKNENNRKYYFPTADQLAKALVAGISSGQY